MLSNGSLRFKHCLSHLLEVLTHSDDLLARQFVYALLPTVESHSTIAHTAPRIDAMAIAAVDVPAYPLSPAAAPAHQGSLLHVTTHM